MERKETFAADFYVQRQPDIDRLLRHLIRPRRDSRAFIDLLAPAS